MKFEMKFLRYAMALATVVAMAACTEDGPNEGGENDGDGDEVVNQEPNNAYFGDMAYVINQGSYYLQIEGALSEINLKTREGVADVFTAANERSLGNTPQAGAFYDGRIYIGVYGSNTIEVLNADTKRSIAQISLADAEGQGPRSMVADNGKVYISMYNGYVSRLDTETLKIDATVKVGPNPEGIALRDNYLYVANSDGMNYEVGYGTTVSKIDVETFKVVSEFEVGLNPSQFACYDDNLFLVCAGNYYDVPSTVYRINGNDTSEEIASATLIACGPKYLYMIDAPYGVESPTYSKMSLSNGKITDMGLAEYRQAPVSIAVSPVNNCILIGYNVIDNGYPSYTLPGYVMQFSMADGSVLGTYEAGVYPAYIFPAERY